MTSGIFWKFVLTICGLQLKFILAAALSPSALTCDVTHQDDGSFLYHLSRPPSSSQCETCWEDQNKTVIARNSKFDPKLVQNLTNQFLTLKDCRAHLRYTKNCMGAWEEAHCKFNCSLILSNLLPTTVNSTLICITDNWCLTQLEFGLGVTSIIIFVVTVLVVLQRCDICKCRRRESEATRASYIPANEQIIVEQEEMMVVNIKA